MTHTWDGLTSPRPDGGATGLALDGIAKGVMQPWSSASLAGAGASAKSQVGEALGEFARLFHAGDKPPPHGVLEHLAMGMAALTSLEQAISALVSIIPFPALPSVRILDFDIGLPHAHNHPPNLVPPAPPVPLPSTGPVIPIPYLSGANTVLINGMPAARCLDLGLGIWCGGYFPMYEIFLGSSSVWIEGARASRVAVDITKHCILTTKPSDPVIGPFTGFTISCSSNVFVGGFPMPSLVAILMKYLMKGLFKALGKAIAPLAEHIQSRVPAGSKLSKALCALTGHPVDVATGRVFTSQTDFKLAGRIPIEFKRVYDTSFTRFEGVLGYGWIHSYEMHLWEEEQQDMIVLRDQECNLVGFDRVEVGGNTYNPTAKLWLERPAAWKYVIRPRNRLRSYHFGPIRGPDGIAGHDGRSEATALRLLAVEDRNGNRLDLNYENGRLVSMQERGGRRFLFLYVALAGSRLRLSEIRLALEPATRGSARLASYSYDAAGNLASATDRGLVPWTYAYEGHILIRETNRNGLSFHFEYDGKDASARCLHTWGDGGIYERWITYNPADRTTITRDSLGGTMTFHFNEKNLPVRITDALGGTQSLTYGPYSERHSRTDDAGRMTKYEYDAHGNCVRVTHPDGTTLEAVYDENDQERQFTDETGATYHRELDTRGNTVAITDPLGHRTRFVYDVHGKIVQLIDALSRVTSFRHDALGQCVEMRSPEGATTHFEYEDPDRMVRKIDPLGNVTRYKHDAQGRVVQIWFPGGGTHRYEYDPEGNVVVFTDANGRQTRFRYQGYNKPAERVDATGAVRRYKVDTEGYVTEVLNERHETFRFTRDLLGRITREVSFDGREWRYQYDPSDRMLRKEGPTGSITFLSYDARGRVVERKRPDGTSVRFKYDPVGRLAEARAPGSDLEFKYNLCGRLVSESQNGQIVEYEYDPLHRRTARQSPLGARVEYVYDSKGRISQLRAPGGTMAFEYDAAGRLVRRQEPSTVRETHSYDAEGRLIEQVLDRRADVPIRRGYAYDPESNLVEVKDSARGTTRFDYNPVENLRKVVLGGDGAEEFVFDSTGNLLKRGKRNFTYGGGNRLVQADGVSLMYDEAGNLVEKLRGRASTRYWYDIDNRLVAMESPEEGRTEFAYDALGRRTRKKGRDGEFEFLWDGDVLLAELHEEEAVEYVFQPDGFRPLCRFNERTFEVYHNDHLGTPQEITDASGNIVWSATYDVYGRVNRLGATVVVNPLRFQGQYEDKETGLHYNYYRYYDPDLGRFITQDPIGINGGLNLYRYCQNPVNWADPWGLFDELDIARMGDSGHRGDGLEAHELLQSAWLKEHSSVYQGRGTGFGRDNPAIAIPPDVHKDVTRAQRDEDLHDPAVLRKQSALDNIEKNAEILEKQLIAKGYDPQEAKQAVQDLKEEAIAFAKSRGFKVC
jgi:RHS repeat-associated protein